MNVGELVATIRLNRRPFDRELRDAGKNAGGYGSRGGAAWIERFSAVVKSGIGDTFNRTTADSEKAGAEGGRRYGRSFGSGLSGSLGSVRRAFRDEGDRSGSEFGSKATSRIGSMLSRMKAKVKVDVDVDTDRIGRLFSGSGKSGGIFSGLTSIFGSLFSSGSKLTGMFSSVVGGLGDAGEAASSTMGSMTGMLGSVTKLGGGLTKFAGPVGLAVGLVMEVGGAIAGVVVKMGMMLAIAGAVTFVIGAVGAALGALPALAGAAGVGLLAVMMGMDGIKKAAQVLRPEIDKLKKTASAAFEKSMKPAMLALLPVFPTLNEGVKVVAESLGGMATKIAQVVSSGEGLNNIKGIFAGFKTMVDTMVPGVAQLVGSLLRLGNNSGIFQTLGGIFFDITSKLAGFFDQMGRSGLATEAFGKLRGVISAVVDFFLKLVYHATEFFTGAAPGVESAFRSIGDALGMVDWRGLGAAFGGLVRTCGDFVRQIPPGTWSAIGEALKNVADQLMKLGQNQAVKDFFSWLISMIPAAINWFALFVAQISLFASMVALGFNVAKLAGLTFAYGIVSAMAVAVGGVNMLLNAIPGIPQGWRDASQGAVDSLSSMKDGISGEMDQTVTKIGEHAAGAGQAAGEVGRTAAQAGVSSIAPMPGAMGGVVRAGVGAIGGQAGAAGGAGRDVGAEAARGAGQGIRPMPGQMGRTTGQAHSQVGSFRGRFGSVGIQLASGLARGIASGASSVISAAVGIARSAWNAAKNFLGIASPSRLFQNSVGRFVPLGFARGITKNLRPVEKAMGEMTLGSRLGNNMTMGGGQVKVMHVMTDNRESQMQTAIRDGIREGIAVINSGGLKMKVDPKGTARLVNKENSYNYRLGGARIPRADGRR